MQDRLTTHSLSVADNGVKWLYLGEPEKQVGQIIGVLVPVTAAAHEPGLGAVQAALGRAFSHVLLIANVFVDADLENLGYGIQLYADLAESAAREHDVPILSRGCSDDAMRVWKSRRLAEQLLVRGLCAWGGDKTP